MNNIENYFDFISTFDWKNNSIDVCHNALLFGTILSAKPIEVLELGIGSGYATKSILYALRYNQIGHLTTVDNFHDGKIYQLIKELEDMGATVCAPVTEESFVRGAKTDSYDLLVSDADHTHSGDWVEEIYRIVKPNGIMFFHDIFYTESVNRYLKMAISMNKPHFVFNVSSRSEEECHNGWLMVKNTK